MLDSVKQVEDQGISVSKRFCFLLHFLPTAVRVGRYSKKQKARNLAEIESLSTKEKIQEREQRDREMYTVIQKLVQAYEGTCFTNITQAHVSGTLQIKQEGYLLILNYYPEADLM